MKNYEPMSASKMHANEVETNVQLVRRLLAAQFPGWGDLPIKPVKSAGTDNAIYRLGDDMAVRLPRIESAISQVEKDHRWLPKFAPHLPLAIPIPLARGVPGEDYPWYWSIYTWLEGESPTAESLTDLRQAAIDLAQFVTALQRIDPTDGPPPGPQNGFRGAPLATRDAPTREAIAALDDMLDTEAALAAWEADLHAPGFREPPVWIHGDLLSGNLLAVEGKLSAVIDFGCMGVGDPAGDLIVAWNLLSAASRDVFRATLAVDDATWARGRGWALSQALIFIPYYLDTNPVGVNNARRVVAEVLADHRHDG